MSNMMDGAWQTKSSYNEYIKNRVYIEILETVREEKYFVNYRGYKGLLGIEEHLIDIFLYILEGVGVRGHDLGVLFSDNGRIRELNKRYRGKDKSTDVLSFEDVKFESLDEEGLFGRKYLGDMVISLEAAAENIKGTKLMVEEETCKLMVHGVLHLLGYDHERGEREREEMEKIEVMLSKEVVDKYIC